MADGYLEKVPDNIPDAEPEPLKVSSGKHCGFNIICIKKQNEKIKKLRHVSPRVLTLI